MYYCKNCGQQYVTDEAVICVKCGAQEGCGQTITVRTADSRHRREVRFAYTVA